MIRSYFSPEAGGFVHMPDETVMTFTLDGPPDIGGLFREPTPEAPQTAAGQHQEADPGVTTGTRSRRAYGVPGGPHGASAS